MKNVQWCIFFLFNSTKFGSSITGKRFEQGSQNKNQHQVTMKIYHISEYDRFSMIREVAIHQKQNVILGFSPYVDFKGLIRRHR